MIPLKIAEKRSRIRANLKVPLAVYQHNTRQLIGYAVDISAGGIRVYSETSEIPQTPLWVSVSLPIQRNNIWREVPFKIQQVWSQYDTNDQATAIGFKFLDIELNVLFAIQKLMDEHSSLA